MNSGHGFGSTFGFNRHGENLEIFSKRITWPISVLCIIFNPFRPGATAAEIVVESCLYR